MSFTPPAGNINFTFYLDPEDVTIAFPAYITSMDISYNPSWDSFQEVGRADSKVLYKQFAKSISLQFKVVAESEERNTIKMFKDLEILTKSITPRYYNSGYQGNFIIFTIGNVFVKQVGYVTSLEYTWNNTEVTWDISNQLPHWTQVSMDIAWIGRLMPYESSNFFLPAASGETDPPGPKYKVPIPPPQPPPEKLNTTVTPFETPNTPPAPPAPSLGSSNNFLKLVAFLESSNGKNMGDPSKAYGLYQFQPSTWEGLNKQLGTNYPLEDRANREISTRMAYELTKQNRKSLERTFKRKVDDAELYEAHFFGISAATKFIKATQSNPDKVAASLFPREAAQNRNIFYTSSGRARTVGEVHNLMRNKIVIARKHS